MKNECWCVAEGNASDVKESQTEWSALQSLAFKTIVSWQWQRMLWHILGVSSPVTKISL